MPIRLNLLAEQQAAEEARRRDPVKRALWGGGFAVALVLLWAGSVQLKLSRVKAEMVGHEAHWKKVEPAFLQMSNDFRESGLIRRKLDALQRYSTNRFFWANTLNALQRVGDDKVRVVNLTGNIGFAEHKQVLVSTSMFINLPPKSWWKWSSEPLKTNVLEAARALLGAITNRPDMARYQPELISTLIVTTNPIQIVAKVEVVKPETITERATLVMRARDYSTPPDKRMDGFNSAITNASYFKQFLGKTNSTVQPELLKSRDDATDMVNPGDLFIPFTVEFFFPDKIRSND